MFLKRGTSSHWATATPVESCLPNSTLHSFMRVPTHQKPDIPWIKKKNQTMSLPPLAIHWPTRFPQLISPTYFTASLIQHTCLLSAPRCGHRKSTNSTLKVKCPPLGPSQGWTPFCHLSVNCKNIAQKGLLCSACPLQGTSLHPTSRPSTPSVLVDSQHLLCCLIVDVPPPMFGVFLLWIECGLHEGPDLTGLSKHCPLRT